jgi:predicted metal-dependent phosphoesterase TrpH
MIDLHSHSTASDGTLAPAALVELAVAKGLEALALTDHDTAAGLAAATERARPLGLQFVSGIELSAAGDGYREIHVLGYGFDPDDARLAGACERLRASRRERAQRIVSCLNQHGLTLPIEDVLKQAMNESVGRPHVARALVAAGYATSLQQAFQRWLVPGAPAYVEKQRLAAHEAVELITGAGGLAVLAHPGTLKVATEDLSELLGHLVRAGLGGVEAYWSRHTEAEVEMCEALARRYDLVVTGGSDFHGTNKPGVELGVAAGGRLLPLEVWERIQQRLPKRTGRQGNV